MVEMKVIIERIFKGHVDLTADTISNLHDFAKAVGLKIRQFRNARSRPHYRINDQKVHINCLKKGAMPVTIQEFIRYQDIWYLPEEKMSIILKIFPVT